MGPIGADVRVIGVGGAGGNVVRRMAESGALGTALLVAANTDHQALTNHPADLQVLLGRRTTGGLGAGGRPSVGFAAARESVQDIHDAVAGADLVFIAAGMGGGTGTGAAPLIAHHARELGALVIGVVTQPFAFEGSRRRGLADQGIAALEEQVDSLLLIENERLVFELDEPTVITAFERADAILSDAVRGIGDLVLRPGLINLDFADLAAVMQDGGRAVMGVGAGRGTHRALRAVEAAGESPLLAQGTIEGATGVLMSFTVDPRLGIGKIHQAAASVQALVDDEAEILFGVAVDPDLEDEVHVTLVATGISADATDNAAPLLRRKTKPQCSEAAPVARPFKPAKAEPTVSGNRRRNALVMLG